MFRRAGGNFYSRDKITGRSESLGTSERTQAKQLLAARNQAAAQPQLNGDAAGATAGLRGDSDGESTSRSS